MSIISLSVDSEKSRLVFRKSSHYFHFREFFLRSFHLYEVFVCMSFAYEFSSVWVLRMSFRLYEFCVWVFICMNFACEFCIWVLHVNFACEFCMWVLHVSFACEFCMWVLHVNFACGFCMWVLHVSFASEFCEWVLRMSFHLWGFFLRSIRTKHFFDENIIIRMFFCNAKLVYIII